MPWIGRLAVLVLAIVAAMAPGAVASAEPVVSVARAAAPISLVPRTELTDPDGSFSAQDAAARLAAPDATVVTGVFSRGYTGDTVWARMVLDVDPDAAGRWYLSLQLPNLDRLQVYTVPDDGPPVPLVALGDRVPEPTDIRTRFHLAPLDLVPGRTVLLVRGRTGSTMTLDLQLRQIDEMMAEEQDFLAVQTFYLGIAAVFALGAFGLFVYTRQAIHLIYVANVIAHLGIWLIINGTGPGHLWPGIARSFHADPHFFVAMSIAATAAFSGHFLSGVRVPVLARKVLWGLAIIGLALMLVCLVAPERYSYFTSALVSTFILPGACSLLVLTAIGLVRGEPAARPLMLTWVGLIAAVVLATLRDTGMIPSNAFTLTGAQLGSVFEMIVFAYMLLERLGRLQREKEALQQQALAAAREQEAVLERRVADRTAELDAAVERERNARRLQQQFVSMVSHEFRTPLAIVDATASNFVARDDDDRSRLEKIHDAVRRLREMIEICLIDDQLEDGKIRLQPEDMELCDMIEDVVDMLGAASEDHRFELVWPDEPVVAKVDPRLFVVAVNNVLENAVKYSPIGSKVDVSVTAGTAEIEIAVTDRGPGVPEAQRERIFDKFFRAENNAGTAGAGLGLFLVRSILAAHGGTIHCEAGSTGGARFVIRLPTAAVPASVPA